jgi:hypothetical protein
MSLPRYADFQSIRTRDLSWLDISGTPPVAGSLLTVGANPRLPDRASWTRDPSLNSVTLGGSGLLTYSGGSLLVNGVPFLTGSAGTNYSDYLYWNPSSSSWAVGSSTIHIGKDAGLTGQATYAVAIGWEAGKTSQGAGSIAIGLAAAIDLQGANAVSIGHLSGTFQQGANSISIGNGTGNTSQGTGAIALGYLSGAGSQGQKAIAIGYSAAAAIQGTSSIAIGDTAGEAFQANSSIAIGTAAGNTSQGADSIAIGRLAGYVNQPTNSIALNATGAQLNPDASGFYVTPVRNTSSGSYSTLRYDTARNEIAYSNFGVYGAGIATFGATDTSANVVFPGITSSGIVLITQRGLPQNVGAISVYCGTGTFVIYRITSGSSMDVSWAVVTL